MANQIGINIESWKWEEHFEWNPYYITIKEHLSYKEYLNALPSLKNNRLMFMD